MVHVDIAALRSIEREKEISFETIIDALETALLTAYKHTPHSMPHARVAIESAWHRCSSENSRGSTFTARVAA